MLKNKAQSLTEYSVCLAVILVTFITINVYVKRGLQGRYKDLVDKTTTALAQREYEPYYKESDYTNTMGPLGKQSTGTMDIGGSLRRDLSAPLNMSAGGTSYEHALQAKE